MKINRYKRVQKHLTFYKNVFSFRPPYQILVDGTFCAAALKYRVNIREQMPKYLGDEVKLCTTVCAIMETERLGPPMYGTMLVIKQFPVRICGHEKNPIGAASCFHNMVRKGNPDHYMVATQDPDFSERIRALAGVPLLFMCNAISMEKPSAKSFKVAAETALEKVKTPDYQTQVLNNLKKKENLVEDEKTRKKRKISGPNPLSCKKKKTPRGQPKSEDSPQKKSRRHKRVKVARHVHEELLKKVMGSQ
ncbi:rRNA-processing protein UTP23 homolog [Ornithodoros turicata]|uniref:rRNA-processing protein UTP23 homolog n=1 Tax=Ornithodoros turicata TaxID=34597 RepID=UPI00313930A0